MKILYVEDDPESVELVRLELQHSAPDAVLHNVATLKEARQLLRPEADFDLLLVDLRLPDGSGPDLMAEVRKKCLPVAIVILTGFGDEMTAVAAFKGGANDYLVKGAEYRPRLLATLEGALSRFRASQEQHSRPLHVLYAERSRTDIDLTRRHLARYAPHIHLEVVNTGQEVLGRLTDHKKEKPFWDVLLLDYRLAGLNALDILRVVLDERQLDIPVVLVTGQGDEGVAASALNLGAVDYLVKHSGYLHELPSTLESARNQAQLVREQMALRRSEADARRRAAEVSALLEISLALTTLDLDASLKEIGHRARALFEADGCRIFLTDADEKTLGCVLALEEYGAALLGYRLPFGQGITGAVAQAGQAEIVQDVLEDLRAVHMPSFPKQAQSMILAPLQEQNEVIGVLTISRTLPAEPFQPRDLELLRALASLASVALTKARLHEQTRSRLAELEALYAISTELRSAQSLQPMLPNLLSRGLALLNTDAGAIWLYEPTDGLLYSFAASGWFRNLNTYPMRPGEGVGGTVFSSGQPHISPELITERAARSQTRSQIPPGWSGICLPIRTATESVGVLYVALPLPRQISRAEVGLLESLVELAGSVIHRLQLWQRVQTQAQLVQQMIETITDGALLINRQGEILLANPAGRSFLACLGHREDELLQHLDKRPLQEFLTPPPPGSSHELIVDGYIFEVEVQPTAGQPEGWVLIATDVTEQRNRRRFEEAQERLATVGQLAAGIAHDFGNVLGAILLYAQSLEQIPHLLPRQRQAVSTIQQQAKHAGNLIRQILDFSRQSIMERLPLDLLLLVKEHTKLLEHILPETIRVEFVYEQGDFVVNADPTRIQQVLMNLSINARDSMPAGGVLRFGLEQIRVLPDKPSPLPDMAVGEWIAIAVQDSGTGIDSADLPHIFTPFYTTKEVGRGTGLGLAQVYGIIKQHGGDVQITSHSQQGSTFTIYLPSHHGEMDDNPQERKGVLSARGKERILVVEDNEAIRMALFDGLESLGYEVTVANDGTEALERLAEEQKDAFALVISDVVMPRMGGVELSRYLRQHHPDLPVLLVTGHPLDGDTDGGKGIEWMQKPFELAALAEKISQLKR